MAFQPIDPVAGRAFTRGRHPRGLTFLVLVSTVLQPAASIAAPERAADERQVEALLADLDAAGLSDALEAKQRELAPGGRVSVVVTFNGPSGVRTARDAVGA